jgi:ABC-type transporter MlaC component
MKRLFLFAGCALLLLAPLSSSSVAQNPPAASNEQQQIARAVRELQEQQTAIAQNQTKMEEKVAAIEEAMRQARIFANRAGAGRR